MSVGWIKALPDSQMLHLLRIIRRTAVFGVPGSCAPRWCVWAGRTSHCCGWRPCLSLVRGSGRMRGSGSTGPCTEASHSGTPGARYRWDTDPHVIQGSCWAPVCVGCIYVYIFGCNTYLSIIFLNCKMPVINFAANLPKIKLLINIIILHKYIYKPERKTERDRGTSSIMNELGIIL